MLASLQVSFSVIMVDTCGRSRDRMWMCGDCLMVDGNVVLVFEYHSRHVYIRNQNIARLVLI